jgi:two-component system CheB/CheR fusion protein
VVVDRSLSVLIWNRRAEELWGLRAEETRGRPFLSLDIGFPVDKLAKPLRSVLGGNGVEPMIQESVDRRGKTFQCRVRFSPLVAKDKQQREGAIMMMDDEWV